MELKHNLSFDIGTIVPTLLIVPYGIETIQAIELNFVQLSFNRTLWN